LRRFATVLGAVVAVAATAAPARPAAPTDVVTRWNVGVWTVWRVERPALRVGREYPEIRVVPGDRVLVDAGGCAARATASIPGATEGFVPMATIVRRELTVGPSGEPAALALSGECRDERGSWVMVGVQHALDETLPLPRPMDLVSSGPVDANGIPLNPRWGLQQTEPGALPNPVELCFDVPGWFDNPICTVQRPSVDRPTGVRGAICRLGATTPINGHVNWFAATYAGPIYWDQKFWSDQDINMFLVPPDQHGLTSTSGEAILCEFDARETLSHFATPWWKDLRRWANVGADERARAMVDGRPAVVTGLLGLDCEHDCHSELHPVWALGVQAKNAARKETWALFARNWGNEGFCSSQQHHLEVVANRITMTLPWREGAAGVRLGRGTRFFANVAGVRGWWTETPGQHVHVTFELPAPAERGRVHGEIVLVWEGPAADAATVRADSRPRRREREDNPERLAADLIAGMTREQRRALAAREPRATATPDGVPVVLQHGPPSSLRAQALFAPSVRAVGVPDPARDADDLRRLELLVQLYGGRVPGRLRDLPRLLEGKEP
jgi:hypothetical protein